MREFKIGDKVRKYRIVESLLANFVEVGDTGIVIGEVDRTNDGFPTTVLISNPNARVWSLQHTDVEELELV